MIIKYIYSISLKEGVRLQCYWCCNAQWKGYTYGWIILLRGEWLYILHSHNLWQINYRLWVKNKNSVRIQFLVLKSACPTNGTLQFTRNRYWLVHDNSLDLPDVHYGVYPEKACVCVLWTHQLVWFLHMALQSCGMSNDDCLPLCWKV